MAAVAIFPTATALTSGLPCPDQANPCLQDLSCGACLLTLNADDNILADANFTECSEFYTDVSLLVLWLQNRLLPTGSTGIVHTPD